MSSIVRFSLAPIVRRAALSLALSSGCVLPVEGDPPLHEREGDAELSGRALGLREGSVETTSHPDVGMLSNGCTGTLISPRIVLTAGHCVSEGLPSTFRVDTAGGSQSFTTSRATYLNNDHERIFTGHEADIALVLLAAPVPNTLISAYPSMTGVRPIGDERSTRFGYGCFNLRTGEGGGVKRYATLRGTYSRHACFGDSGGPVMFGEGESASLIWGVTTGAYALSVDVPIADTNADAAYFRKLAAGLMRSWFYGLELDMARHGRTYRILLGRRANECRVNCLDDNTRCKAFTWEPSAPDSTVGTCSLNDVIGGMVSAPGFRSGLSDRYIGTASRYHEQGIDRPGAEYRGFKFRGPDGVCSEACAWDHRCQAFTVQNLGGDIRRCSMKDAQPEPVAADGFVSGLKEGLEMDTDRFGSDYRVISQSESYPDKCQAECVRDSRCVAFTWYPRRRGANSTCWLKDGGTTKSARPGFISGTKLGVWNGG